MLKLKHIPVKSFGENIAYIYKKWYTIFIEMIMDYIKENMQTNYKGVTETEGVLW